METMLATAFADFDVVILDIGNRLARLSLVSFADLSFGLQKGQYVQSLSSTMYW